jgi:hypothetical protein
VVGFFDQGFKLDLFKKDYNARTEMNIPAAFSHSVTFFRQ